MKKVLSVMIAAAMISFVACKGKAAEEVPAVDSMATPPPTEMTTTPAEDSAKMMVADSTAKPAEGEKHEDHK